MNNAACVCARNEPIFYPGGTWGLGIVGSSGKTLSPTHLSPWIVAAYTGGLECHLLPQASYLISSLGVVLVSVVLTVVLWVHLIVVYCLLDIHSIFFLQGANYCLGVMRGLTTPGLEKKCLSVKQSEQMLLSC